MTGRPTCKADVEALQRMYGVTNMRDMLALAHNNDPFNSGTAGDWKKARWFADIWNRCGYSNGVHLRRIHYRILSEGIEDYDGKQYLNTEQAWEKLNVAAKHARHLGLVPADAFEDRRNPEPQIYAQPREYDPLPSVDFLEFDERAGFSLPKIPVDLSGSLDLNFPEPDVYGYDYEAGDQPYHLELWIEKSTMNDVLEPVCRRYGINLVTGVGFQSVTRVIELLKRTRAFSRPVRIFYISDFDPAGAGMAKAVARQVEFYMSRHAPGADIRIERLALTREQVEAFNLPRTPIKESDGRKANFEKLNGAGCVELDALEALHKGSLGKIVQDAAERYHDHNLRGALTGADSEAWDIVGEEWDDIASEYRDKVSRIESAVREIVDGYREELQALSDRLEDDLGPYKKRLGDIWQAVHDAASTFNPNLPDRPEGLRVPEDDSVLFNSRRDYMTQLQHYKSECGGAAND